MHRCALTIVFLSSWILAGCTTTTARPGSGAEDGSEAADRGAKEWEGTALPADGTAIAVWPESYAGELLVLDVLPHGSPVQQGEVIAHLDLRPIDEAIRQAELEAHSALVRQANAEEKDRIEREAAASALEQARSALDRSKRALEGWEKYELEFAKRGAELGDRHHLAGIEDQTDELTQLEKMYKADDLTEETEDIVLKRARRDLDRTKKSLDFMTRRDKTMREVDLPREHEALKLEARRSGAERDRVVSVTALQQAQSKLEIERAKANLEKQERDFAKLTADRALFELKAPAAGSAVPGVLARGKWQNADDVKRAMKKGGKFGPGAVLFTIVKTESVRIVTSVPETSLAWIRPGQDAKVVATQSGSAPWTAKVSAVTPFSSSGEYAIELDPTDRSGGPVGMTCKIRVDTGKRTAILVPQTAVEDGGFDKWVHVIGGDGKPARREVVLGQTHDDRVEVTSGLAAGDKVLVTAPKK